MVEEPCDKRLNRSSSRNVLIDGSTKMRPEKSSPPIMIRFLRLNLSASMPEGSCNADVIRIWLDITTPIWLLESASLLCANMGTKVIMAPRHIAVVKRKTMRPFAVLLARRLRGMQMAGQSLQGYINHRNKALGADISAVRAIPEGEFLILDVMHGCRINALFSHLPSDIRHRVKRISSNEKRFLRNFS